MVAVRLDLAHRVAQVCNTDALDHGRVAKNGRRAGEVVEESDSRAKKHRRDVDANFGEEPGIQELLNRVSTMNPNGLPRGGGLGLAHGTLEAVGHEVDDRVGSRPPGERRG